MHEEPKPDTATWAGNWERRIRDRVAERAFDSVTAFAASRPLASFLQEHRSYKRSFGWRGEYRVWRNANDEEAAGSGG
jgi:hypothetical protein